MIFGIDFLWKAGLEINYNTKKIPWFENEIPLRGPHCTKTREFMVMADAIYAQQDDEYIVQYWLNSYLAAPIMDAKYDKVDIPGLIKQQTHLNSQRQESLQIVLEA